MQGCGAGDDDHKARARSGRREPLTGDQREDVLVQGLTEDYEGIKLMVYRGRLFDTIQTQTIVRHLHTSTVSHKEQRTREESLAATRPL